MSHFTSIGTKITDLEALKNSLSQMGLKLEHNQTCRYWAGNRVKENVAKLPGPYDVAFEQNADGTYSIVADFYNGHVERSIGPNGSKLIKGYAMEKIKIEARRRNYSIHVFPNGKIKIYDPTDSSGAYIEATIEENGNVTFKAKGFQGSNCMKFANLEASLGEVSKRRMTDEYYQGEKAMIRNNKLEV